ncbi:hypothetical protein FG93_06162 [Bosea sp. LC85]|nr:hypothetical protein [Bosea sp. LC85]KFC61571.1 hypothetical protein FG93_06162 [Bosea sp. LC85]
MIAILVWGDPERKERCALPHRDDGTFAADGKIIGLRERMQD